MQRPWQEIKQTTWFKLAASLSHCLGLHLYVTNRAPSQMGMPPTWEKDSHLPVGTTKLGNLRDGCKSATAPTAKPDLGFPPLCWESAEVLGPPRDARNVTGVLHRYTRWTGRLSHQTSNLSHPCNLLVKGYDLCFAQYWVQGDAGSDLPS